MVYTTTWKNSLTIWDNIKIETLKHILHNLEQFVSEETDCGNSTEMKINNINNDRETDNIINDKNRSKMSQSQYGNQYYWKYFH